MESEQTTSTTTTTTFHWPPLESDPEIFNNYCHKIGLPENLRFEELFSLDYKEMGIEFSGPILAVIVSYERKKSREDFQDGSIKTYNEYPFYMKQTGTLDNACGLIAALHSIGHHKDSINLSNESILGNFYEKVKNLNDAERAAFLESFNDMKQVHQEFSNQGQSNLCSNQDEVKNHFVAFVWHNDCLVELDGCNKGPRVIKTNIQNEELLDETIEELRKRLESGEISENLAVMVLIKDA